jgi:hypothetical protein|tara:strand:- start:112 stop:558 length:447 start_codon:yes stop_codon:yes gene_type:complete
MRIIKELLKSEKRHQLILGLLFLIYIIFQIQTPHSLALLIDNLYGTIIVLFLALSLFANVNPVIAVVGLFATIELLRRSKVATGSSELIKQLPAQDKRTSEMMAQNHFPMTLEEEIVAKKVPLVDGVLSTPASYKPVLEHDNNATLLH